MTSLPIEALQSLRMMEEYFEPENAVMFEADLIEAHGEICVTKAIHEGVLEHRRLPFRDGHERCICWLTDKGRKLADNA